MEHNKIFSMKNIVLVAREFGENEQLLWDVVGEMVPEDGVIWIYGLDDDHNTVAFSEEGVDALRELIEIHREDEQPVSSRSLT